MRDRLHERRREREARLLDLGALVYELHRQGKRAPELLQNKAAELELIDSEVRRLEAQLGEEGPRESATSDEAVRWEDDTREGDAVDDGGAGEGNGFDDGGAGDANGGDGGGNGSSD